MNPMQTVEWCLFVAVCMVAGATGGLFFRAGHNVLGIVSGLALLVSGNHLVNAVVSELAAAAKKR